MWIMTSYGILMPAAIPEEIRQDLIGSAWGLQIRSRDRKTLAKTRRVMKNMGNNVSPIVATPMLDYEYRFYCSRRDFATLIADEILTIDYEKFKPTTELKGGGGKRLHHLYNRIWGVVASHYDSL
jgi:hypothetical protein